MPIDEVLKDSNCSPQDVDEIVLIDTLSGESRKNSYPNGDIVNPSLGIDSRTYTETIQEMCVTPTQIDFNYYI